MWIFFTWAGPLEVPAYVSPKVRVKRVPSVRYYQHLAAIPYYVWHLVKNHYDHVFVNFADYGEGPALTIARRITNLPFSIVFHFPPSLVPHRYRGFTRWGFNKTASHLIAVSQATAKEVEGWARRRCDVIEHGVNTERFKPDVALREQTRRELGTSLDASVLISVAALEERKGMQWGIRAMHHLLREYPNLHYIIVGEGEYHKPLEMLAVDMKVQDQVHFLGAQLDVRPYLCAADIMLVLSQGEAGSVSLLEAMSCQLASVTSSQPPFDDLMDEAWGRKVNEKDTEQVATVLAWLLKESRTREQMGKAARDHVISLHQWHQVAKQYQELVGVE